MLFIFVDKDNNDVLTLKNIERKNPFDIYNEFIEAEKKMYNKSEFLPHDPFFILRFKSVTYDCTHKIERFEEAKKELYKADEWDDCLIQKYIRSTRKATKKKLKKINTKQKTKNFFSQYTKNNETNFISILDQYGNNINNQDKDKDNENNNNNTNLNNNKLFNINVSEIHDGGFPSSHSDEENKKEQGVTKPTTIRLHYKTKANSSKKVIKKINISH